MTETEQATTPTSTTSTRQRNPDVLGDGKGNFRLIASDGENWSMADVGFVDATLARRWAKQNAIRFTGMKVICVRVCWHADPQVETVEKVSGF